MPILGNNRNIPLISFKSNSSLNLWNIYISACNFYPSRRARTSLKQNFPRLQQLKFVYPVQTRLPFKSTRYNSFSGWIFLKGTAETTVASVRCSLQTCQVRGSIAEKGSNFQDENWVAAGRRWFAGSFRGKCRRNLRGFEMNREPDENLWEKIRRPMDKDKGKWVTYRTSLRFHCHCWSFRTACLSRNEYPNSDASIESRS